MKREEAKDLFRNDKDAYGKLRAIMHKIDQIFDAFEKPLPPAEGAEEFIRAKIADHKLHECYPTFVPELAQVMTDFATLHAQRMAEKMVEEKYDAFIRWVVASEVVLFNGRWNILNMESMNTQELYRHWTGLQKENQVR